MAKRKFPINLELAKKLKKKITEAKNHTETIRLLAMVEYFKGKNSGEVAEGLGISRHTITEAMNAFEVLGEDEFYKTQFKGRIESQSHIEDKKVILKMIGNKEKSIDISDVSKELQKLGREYEYKKVRRLTRKRLKLNYQKPFITNEKQSEFAKEIASGRIRKALYNIALEEKEIDIDGIKNKKTKFGQSAR